ncbi:hypothetical protein PIB30_020222 [Stylosanthes scabra]|uniref:Uncharacterized protein n=1 Tax=Stylosanthes scabra TaxID=79078 RepID=A0ABU6S806_9FABA|nr:hypothetical protein [Stylosanthes scabra]
MPTIFAIPNCSPTPYCSSLNAYLCIQVFATIRLCINVSSCNCLKTWCSSVFRYRCFPHRYQSSRSNTNYYLISDCRFPRLPRRLCLLYLYSPPLPSLVAAYYNSRRIWPWPAQFPISVPCVPLTSFAVAAIRRRFGPLSVTRLYIRWPPVRRAYQARPTSRVPFLYTTHISPISRCNPFSSSLLGCAFAPSL